MGVRSYRNDDRTLTTRDNGCSLWRKCLTCPFPRCRYDGLTDQEIITTRMRLRKISPLSTISVISNTLGVSEYRARRLKVTTAPEELTSRLYPLLLPPEVAARCEEIIAAVEAASGMTLDELQTTRRRCKPMHMAAIKEMVRELAIELTVCQIGSLLHRDHSTILYHLKGKTV